MVIVFAAFWSLFLVGLRAPDARATLRRKSRTAWLLDGTGLLAQGFLVPVLEVVLVMRLLALVAPAWRSSVTVHPALAFLLNFVLVDYVYYWNHRLLHGRHLWRIHAVHHSVTEMDVLGTSRNVLWAPLVIVYLYLNAFFLFVLDERSAPAFALGAAVSASLDLWRHSRLALARGGRLHRLLSAVLITPHEHAWHHSKDDPGTNFGANLSWWDRLHGTYRRPEDAPRELGIPIRASLLAQLVLPPVEGPTTNPFTKGAPRA